MVSLHQVPYEDKHKPMIVTIARCPSHSGQKTPRSRIVVVFIIEYLGALMEQCEEIVCCLLQDNLSWPLLSLSVEFIHKFYLQMWQKNKQLALWDLGPQKCLTGVKRLLQLGLYELIVSIWDWNGCHMQICKKNAEHITVCILQCKLQGTEKGKDILIVISLTWDTGVQVPALCSTTDFPCDLG